MPDCSRPWAYWQFELGEERPRDPAEEIKRPTELGQLSRHELAALAEKANEAGRG
jgi:hypothetical protein